MLRKCQDSWHFLGLYIMCRDFLESLWDLIVYSPKLYYLTYNVVLFESSTSVEENGISLLLLLNIIFIIEPGCTEDDQRSLVWGFVWWCVLLVLIIYLKDDVKIHGSNNRKGMRKRIIDRIHGGWISYLHN